MTIINSHVLLFIMVCSNYSVQVDLYTGNDSVQKGIKNWSATR